MNRTTHMLMGIAAAAPVAAILPPAGALGCLWLGMSGGVLPDYFDLRSSARHFLRHRGTSHSLIVVAITTALIWVVSGTLAAANTPFFPVPDRYLLPWTLSLALGMLSHLAGDACTRAGIQPFLPLLKKRVWLAPRWFRGRSDGWINVVARLASAALFGLCLGGFLMLNF